MRMIDADYLKIIIEECAKDYSLNEDLQEIKGLLLEMLDSMPTIDPVEIAKQYIEFQRDEISRTIGYQLVDKGEKHGRWKQCFEDWRKQIEGDECSVCGFQHYGTSIGHYNYCPNCGAKMDGGNESEL